MWIIPRNSVIILCCDKIDKDVFAYETKDVPFVSGFLNYTELPVYIAEINSHIIQNNMIQKTTNQSILSKLLEPHETKAIYLVKGNCFDILRWKKLAKKDTKIVIVV